jgi:hypothetical protein
VGGPTTGGIVGIDGSVALTETPADLNRCRLFPQCNPWLLLNCEGIHAHNVGPQTRGPSEVFAVSAVGRLVLPLSESSADLYDRDFVPLLRPHDGHDIAWTQDDPC